MTRRLILAACITLTMALVTIVTWSELRDRNDRQVARIAEAESYAARSQLIRNFEMMLAALSDTRRYWEQYGHQPRDQWASDAAIELAHFEGLGLILWDDPERGNRYARTPEHPQFDYRPADDEWQSYQSLVSRLREASESKILGPFVDDDGNVTIEAYVVDGIATGGSGVAALIRAPDSLAPLLQDESPGYAIRVEWDDVILYERGEPAPDLQPEWERTGLIQTTMGSLWNVVHAPTKELRASFQPLVIDTFLALGLIIALLVGTLAFENGRARSRAAAAERAERELAELNYDLEKSIASRTGMLANRTAVLQTITDSVSHDLRNPLNSISINANLLRHQLDDAFTPEHQTVFDRITRGIGQMIEILDRLMGLSGATHSTFNPEPLDMRTLFQAVFDELLATDPDPPVEFGIDDELPDAVGDRRLVQMLAVNLLSNALKYSRERDVRRIDVGFERAGGHVTYRVRDNGIGFDARQAENMFAAFQRLDNSANADGHGLGLAIAASVVNRHEGKIWAEGAPGDGAMFYFTLQPDDAGEPVADGGS